MNHLLNSLDGSYLRSDQRIADAGPWDAVGFDDGRKELVQGYLRSEAKDVAPAVELASQVIDGFESPFGTELLASVDWLLSRERVAPDVPGLLKGLVGFLAAQLAVL